MRIMTKKSPFQTYFCSRMPKSLASHFVWSWWYWWSNWWHLKVDFWTLDWFTESLTNLTWILFGQKDPYFIYFLIWPGKKAELNGTAWCVGRGRPPSRHSSVQERRGIFWPKNRRPQKFRKAGGRGVVDPPPVITHTVSGIPLQLWG